MYKVLQEALDNGLVSDLKRVEVVTKVIVLAREKGLPVTRLERLKEELEVDVLDLFGDTIKMEEVND